MEFIISCLVFVIAIFGILFWVRDTKTSYSFLIADRSVSSFRIAASLSSGFRDGAGIAAWVAFTYYFDIGAIWLFVGMAVALLYLSILAPKIRSMVNESGIYSLNQFCSHYIGEYTGTLTVFLLCTTSLLIAAAQLHIAGTIAGSLMGVSGWYGILFIASVVGTYLFIGGYKAVVITDVFEWLILFVIFLVPIFLIKDDMHLSPNWSAFSSPGKMIYSLVPLVFLIISTGGDVWQRIFSAKDGVTARKGLLLTAPFYLILSVGVILFSLSVKTVLPDAPAGEAFLLLFNSNIFGGWFIGILGLFTVAAITSTVDTQTFVFASALTTSKWGIKNNTSEDFNRHVPLLRLLIIAFLLIISVIAFYIGDIVIFLFSSYSISTILFPILIFIVLRGKNTLACQRSDKIISVILIFSMVVYIALWAGGAYTNFAFTLVTPIFSSISMIVYRVLFKNHSNC